MQILMPHVSCVVHENELQDAIKQNYAEIYVLTPGGTFKRKALKGGRHLTYKVDIIPKAVSSISEEINFLPAGKIPQHFLDKIIKFFLEVIEKKSAPLEAMAYILWNPTDGYHIAIPNQTISGASVTYDRAGVMKKGDILVVDVHSHNFMGAFFSGTDDNDDRLLIGYSGVIGKMNEARPSTVWRFNINEIKREANVHEIFDIPTDQVTINPKWIDNITVKPTAIVGSALARRPWAGRQADLLEGEWGVGGHFGLDAHEMDRYYEDAAGGRHSTSFNPKEGVYSPRSETGRREQAVASDVSLMGISPGEDAYYIAQYGTDAAEAKDQIEAWMEHLEGVDEILIDLISQFFQLLSADGQQRIMTVGIR